MVIGTRRHIPVAAKEQLITMSNHLTTSVIATATHINVSTVNRVRRLHRETGWVERKALIVGRPRVLNALDVVVSLPSFQEIHLPISKIGKGCLPVAIWGCRAPLAKRWSRHQLCYRFDGNRPERVARQSV